MLQFVVWVCPLCFHIVNFSAIFADCQCFFKVMTEKENLIKDSKLTFCKCYSLNYLPHEVCSKFLKWLFFFKNTKFQLCGTKSFQIFGGNAVAVCRCSPSDQFALNVLIQMWSAHLKTNFVKIKWYFLSVLTLLFLQHRLVHTLFAEHVILLR